MSKRTALIEGLEARSMFCSTADVSTTDAGLVSYLKGHEGDRLHVYADSLGIATIGVGVNLEAAGAKANLTAAKVDYDALMAGWAKTKKTWKASKIASWTKYEKKHPQVETITEAQSTATFKTALGTAIADAKSSFKGATWKTLDHSVKIAMTDMVFNMGKAKFLGFKRMIAALNAGKLGTAIAEIKDSDYYDQFEELNNNRANDNIAELVDALKCTDSTTPAAPLPLSPPFTVPASLIGTRLAMTSAAHNISYVGTFDGINNNIYIDFEGRGVSNTFFFSWLGRYDSSTLAQPGDGKLLEGGDGSNAFDFHYDTGLWEELGSDGQGGDKVIDHGTFAPISS